MDDHSPSPNLYGRRGTASQGIPKENRTQSGAVLAPIEAEPGQQEHRNRSPPRPADPEPVGGVAGFDGVRCQGVEADDPRAALEDVGRRGTGLLIPQGEPSEPVIQSRDSAVECAEVISTAQPPGGRESRTAQDGGIGLGRVNSSRSSGTTVGAASSAPANRSKSCASRVMR